MAVVAASGAGRRPQARVERRFRCGPLGSVVLVLVTIQSACWLWGLDTGFSHLRQRRGSSPSGSLLAGSPRFAGGLRPRLPPAKSGPLMPEKEEDIRSANRISDRYESTFAKYSKIWAEIKKGARKGSKKVKEGDVPLPKFFILGIAGANLHNIGHMLGTALDYVRTEEQAPYLFRDPVEENFTPAEYWFGDTEEEVQNKVKKASSDVFYEDLDLYRATETEVLKDFNGYKDDGHPFVCITGDGIAFAEENRAILGGDNVALWFDSDPTFNWEVTQSQSATTGIYTNAEAAKLNKPPVFALANGWDGDVDDVEGKEEFSDMCNQRREAFEKIADVRIRVDLQGIKENPVWALEKMASAMFQLFGIKDEEGKGETVGEENLSADLLKFLEGARLHAYHEKALEWCKEQGAVTLDEVAENAGEMAEGLGLKPLERKRLDKAAEAFAPQAA